MSVIAQSADGTTHEFPDGTDPSVVDRVMKQYAQQSTAKTATAAPSAPDTSTPYLTDIGRALGSEATGVRDVALEGPAQLLTHMLPTSVVEAGNEFNNWLRSKGVPLAEMPTKNLEGLVSGKTDVTLDEYERQRQQQIQQERQQQGLSGPDAFRAVGQVMAPTNVLLPGGGATAAARIGTAALGGAVGGALAPITGEGDYWSQKGKQAEIGAATGLGVGAGGEVLSKIISPKLREAAQTLLDNGVNLTPGQLFGGVAKRAEEAAKSAPWIGSAIRSGERNALEGFNRATINRALAPIGQELPKDALAGHEAIAAGQKILSDAYDDLLPKLSFGMDQGFKNDITALRQVVSEFPKDRARQFEDILTNRVGKRAAAPPAGTMDGKTFKQVQSELTNLSGQFKSSSDASERMLGHALDDVNSAMRDALERQNPSVAPQLRNINNAYAMFTRAENAAGRRATSGGLFTPGDLLQAVKGGDRTVRKRAFAAGDALMQDWAEAAHSVLGNKMPDSGTTERMLWDLGGAGGLGYAAMYHPEVALGLAAGSVPYTAPAMTLARKAVTAAPQARAQFAKAIGPALAQIPGMAGVASTGLAESGSQP